MKNGADVNVKRFRKGDQYGPSDGDNGKTPLELASQNKHTEIVKLLSGKVEKTLLKKSTGKKKRKSVGKKKKKSAKKKKKKKSAKKKKKNRM